MLVTGALTFWVIYDRPRDYPAYFVVRAQDVVQGQVVPRPYRTLAGTVEEARSHLPKHCVPMPLFEGDDPAILEVYMEAAIAG